MTAGDYSLRIIVAIAALVAVGMAGLFATEAHAYARAARDDIQRMLVEEASRSRNVPASLALAVAKVESNFNPQALSSAGARGVMQIMPATGRGEFGVHPDSLWDARLNVQVGVRFLDDLIDRYGGRWDLALSHYNGGSRVGMPPNARVIPETRGYVDAVLAWQRRFERSETMVALAGQARGQQVAAADRPGKLPYADIPSDYMMFDDRGVARDWRHYLGVADYWLRRRNGQAADPATQAQAPASVPAASAAAVDAEPAAPSAILPVADDRPSVQLQRNIEQRRQQFRESLSSGRAW